MDTTDRQKYAVTGDPVYRLADGAVQWLADLDPRIGYNPATKEPNLKRIALAAGIPDAIFWKLVNGKFRLTITTMGRLVAYAMRFGYTEDEARKALFVLPVTVTPLEPEQVLAA